MIPTFQAFRKKCAHPLPETLKHPECLITFGNEVLLISYFEKIVFCYLKGTVLGAAFLLIIIRLPAYLAPAAGILPLNHSCSRGRRRATDFSQFHQLGFYGPC